MTYFLPILKDIFTALRADADRGLEVSPHRESKSPKSHRRTDPGRSSPDGKNNQDLGVQNWDLLAPFNLNLAFIPSFHPGLGLRTTEIPVTSRSALNTRLFVVCLLGVSRLFPSCHLGSYQWDDISSGISFPCCLPLFQLTYLVFPSINSVHYTRAITHKPPHPHGR